MAFCQNILDEVSSEGCVSSRLREMREKRGLTQSELARAVGVSRQVVSSIEANSHTPSLKVALKLASHLDTKVEEIFSDETETLSSEPEILTKLQRLNFANQYAILKHLCELSKNDHMARHYGYREDIFERGYSYLYREALENIWDEKPLREAEEVIAILNLHRAMLWSLGPDPDPQKVKAVRFQGFDGNYEASQLLFAQFFQQEPGPGRFKELLIENSHHHTLPRYRRMLQEWKKLKENHRLTWNQIQQILDAGSLRKT